MLTELSILHVRQGCGDLTLALDHNVRLLDECHERAVGVRDLLREYTRDMWEALVTNAITEADGHRRCLRQNGAGLRE